MDPRDPLVTGPVVFRVTRQNCLTSVLTVSGASWQRHAVGRQFEPYPDRRQHASACYWHLIGLGMLFPNSCGIKAAANPGLSGPFVLARLYHV